MCWINWLCQARRELDDGFVHFSAFTQTFLLSMRVSIHCRVTSVIFISRLPVSPLWWDRWKLRSVPCPLLPCGLQTLGRVCFACSAEWKLFPPSGRWCSVCPPCRRSRERERAAIKSDLPQCLMVASWCKHRPQDASQWPEQLRDSVCGTLNVFCETHAVLEMNKMTCKRFWNRHMFLLWNQNKIWRALLRWRGFSLNFDLPYFSAEVLLI